ncbi:hypothetical protein BU14_2848s0001 [Porphyra umbilicalis]|uniref:Uncharacterized protein n=1 Tax=Porphyra umbilicalis TaxID=2786 RepID=A0A1X6NJ87_PORUM|nr:hypothetical protein BU14_2848s0001 [Porphyra umbilicalis]|eukprot:OSX68413.1 hypothetical protein BU14_2848s0001 [Porphyra umbilicalis]
MTSTRRCARTWSRAPRSGSTRGGTRRTCCRCRLCPRCGGRASTRARARARARARVQRRRGRRQRRRRGRPSTRGARSLGTWAVWRTASTRALRASLTRPPTRGRPSSRAAASATRCGRRSWRRPPPTRPPRRRWAPRAAPTPPASTARLR